MDQVIRDRMDALSTEHKALFSQVVDQELAEAAVEIVQRFRKVVRESRNDQAATAAGRVLMSLILKRGVLKVDTMDAFTEDLMRAMSDK